MKFLKAVGEALVCAILFGVTRAVRLFNKTVVSYLEWRIRLQKRIEKEHRKRVALVSLKRDVFRLTIATIIAAALPFESLTLLAVCGVIGLILAPFAAEFYEELVAERRVRETWYLVDPVEFFNESISRYPRRFLASGFIVRSALAYASCMCAYATFPGVQPSWVARFLGKWGAPVFRRVFGLRLRSSKVRCFSEQGRALLMTSRYAIRVS